MMVAGPNDELDGDDTTPVKDLDIIGILPPTLHCPRRLLRAVQFYYAGVAQCRGVQDTARVCAVLEKLAGRDGRDRVSAGAIAAHPSAGNRCASSRPGNLAMSTLGLKAQRQSAPRRDTTERLTGEAMVRDGPKKTRLPVDIDRSSPGQLSLRCHACAAQYIMTIIEASSACLPALFERCAPSCFYKRVIPLSLGGHEVDPLNLSAPLSRCWSEGAGFGLA